MSGERRAASHSNAPRQSCTPPKLTFAFFMACRYASLLKYFIPTIPPFKVLSNQTVLHD